MCPARSVIVWQKGMDYQKLIHDYYQIKSNINNFAKVLPWIGNINININLNFLLHFRLAQHIHNMIGLKQLELTSSPLPPLSFPQTSSPITPIKELKTTSRSLLKKKKKKEKQKNNMISKIYIHPTSNIHQLLPPPPFTRKREKVNRWSF